MNARPVPRVVTAVAVGLLVLATAACGVPPSDGAQPVESEIAALLDRPGPSGVESATSQVDAVVAWVRNDRLVTATRPVPADSRQGVLDGALAALLAGPSPEEGQRGLTTLLPPDLTVDGVVEGRRVALDLSAASALDPARVPLAVGQTALTALGVPGVRRVVFAVDGDRTQVSLPGGGSTRVVRASDYRAVTG